MSVGDELYASLAPLTQKFGDPNLALSVWVHGAGNMLQEVDDVAKDGPLGQPGWSQAIDLTRAKTAWLPWLGQWVGYAVPPKADSQSEAAYDALERARIVTRSAHRRGSISILREIIQEHLSGSKNVIIQERTSSAHQIAVYVYASEIVTTAAKAEAAARSQKAAGLIMTFTVLTGNDYATLQANNANYTEVMSAHSSYNTVLSNPGA